MCSMRARRSVPRVAQLVAKSATSRMKNLASNAFLFTFILPQRKPTRLLQRYPQLLWIRLWIICEMPANAYAFNAFALMRSRNRQRGRKIDCRSACPKIMMVVRPLRGRVSNRECLVRLRGQFRSEHHGGVDSQLCSSRALRRLQRGLLSEAVA